MLVRLLSVENSPIKPFVRFNLAVQFGGDATEFQLVLASAQVEMQNGILLPVLLQFSHGEALEKVFSTLEVVFQGAAQQALAKPAWATEEDKL